MKPPPLRFIHISDTHIGPGRDFELYGVNTFRAAKALVDAVNTVPAEASFVVHTGDIVAFPDRRAYQLAAEVFSEISLPVYYVTGNHDDSAMIRQTLSLGPCDHKGGDASRLSYRFVVAEHTFLVLDARGPDEIDPHGILAEDQFDILTRELVRGTETVTIFIHFPPLSLDSVWLDDEMLLLNGDRMHRMLSDVASRIRGVFFGHIHRSTVATRDAVLYSGVGSSFRQFCSWPSAAQVAFENDAQACFNLVSLHGETVSIRHHSIPVGFG